MEPVTSAADRLGVLASTACAVHCLTVALLPAALAAVGLSALLGHEAEWAFTLVAVGVACFALVSGWRRGAPPSILALIGVGATGLLAARFTEEAGAHGLGTALALFSGLLLAVGHLRNLRNLRSPTSEPCCAPE